MVEKAVEILEEGKDVRQVAASGDCCKTGPEALRTPGD